MSQTAAELFADDRTVVVARINGVLKDLATEIGPDDVVEPVRSDEPDGLAVLRHSTAHVLAQAVQELFPKAKLGIGPPIENGFYYDFDVETPFTPEDLKALEKQMERIVKSGQRFSRRVVSEGEALEELSHEPYKCELVGLKGGAGDDVMEVGGAELTIYDNVDAKSGETKWGDLCRGPHLPTTRVIPAFKLMRSAAAYWRGSEKNPQLQRIYGTAWATRDDLKAHLAFLEEAEKRDHRRLGVELDLFSFPDEIGSGLAVFHPKGGVIRRTMEDYSRRRHEEAGYDFVYTPHLTKAALFEKSQHLSWYADGMYPPMELDAEYDAEGEIRKPAQKYYMKPMNCPMHNLIFDSRGRSYRELPLRLFEFGTVYRYEKSGVVHGLTRARGFTQDDAHIYTTKEQMAGELDSLLTFVLDLLRDYGLTDFYLELSTRDPEKSVGSDEVWEEATEILRQAALRQNLELVLDPEGAAFYGPKISVQTKDAIGRSWQMSTIQVDFNLPELFDLQYQGADGERHRPVMIHRALFGSIERFFAVLLEHYAGAFPPWLAPVQVVGIPIADEHADYLLEVATKLRAKGIRVDVDTASDRMQKKIRNAQKQKVPYMLIAGDEDIANGAVSFRYRNGEQKNGISIDDAVAEIVAAVESREQILTDVAAEEFEPRSGADAWERLWAPYRMAYIRGENKPSHGEAGDECPFCRSPHVDDDESLVVVRGKDAYVVLNLYPYNSGHVLVCPYRHVSDYTELTDAERDEIAALTQQSMTALRAASGPHGFNLGINQGPIAGAGIAAHLHQHIVPRWGGDTNFMPVVGGTKVLPALLHDTRDLLREHWPR